MKKILNFQVLFALLVAAAPLAATAQVKTYFYDDFSNGSTTNGPSIVGGGPDAFYTSYDIASTKPTIPVTGSAGTNGVWMVPNDFHLALDASTSSGFLEAQTLFVTNAPGGTNAVSLAQPGDYIDVVVVFSNSGTLFSGSTGTASAIWLGLYNSGGNYYPTNGPVAGALANSGLSTTANSLYAAGNCAYWQGYYAQMENGSTASRILTRPIQNQGLTDSANQELFGSNEGGGAFDNPTAVILETAPNSPSYTITAGQIYTMQLIFTLTAPNVMTVSNYLYSGANTNSAPIFSQGTTNISTTNFLTGAFDGLGIGALNKVAGYDPIMDILSISITGTNSVISGPPIITLQPTAVTVATNGACAFIVNASGVNVTYQWHRNGTNLIDGPNISGSTGSGNSSLLVISPAGTSDVPSPNDGYYVTVTGAGGFSTNSVTNSLTLVAATNLFWAKSSASGGTWDVATTASWVDTNSNPQVFNCGDPVTFGNVGSGGGGTVTLTGPYLSAASVMVSNTLGISYTFTGSGSYAGPGNLIFSGTKNLTINNVNSYSGGTIISNASAKLVLGNYNGLGSGPVTLALAGGRMEVTIAGGSSSGINGDVIVNDDFTCLYDLAGSYAGVFLGNLSGTAGKTLTLVPYSVIYYGQTVTNSRVRVYGNNTIYNGNLSLDPGDSSASPGNPMLTFAPYGSSQTYNGVISDTGAVIQKGNVTYLNGPNTYSGGTYLAAGYIGLGQSSTGSADAPSAGPIGTGPLFLWADSTSANPTASGGVFASGGAWTIMNTIEYPSATNNLTLMIGGTNAITFTGSVHLAGNDLYTSNTNWVPPIYTNRIFQVTNTALTTFAGVIDDQVNGASTNMGLTVSGNGTNASGALVLTTTETYTGPTIVTNGANLQVNGALDPASAVTVATNATLSGTGAINGPVTVNAGGALAPGAASIGSINLNNGLTLSGNVNVRVNRSGFVADKAVVTGVLTNTGTGTIKVTNLGLSLQLGDTFYLFNKALSNSAALLVTGGGVAWANNLAVNGSIQVVSPPDIGVLQSGPASVQQGANITNIITVTNIGPNTATGIALTNPLGPYVTFMSATGGGITNGNPSQVVWTGISLPMNSYVILTNVVKSVAGGNATNTVVASSSSTDPNLLNNTNTLITVVIPPTDLGVTVSGPANSTVGTTITYTVVTTNNGPNAASSIIVTDTLPANVTFVSASNSGTTNGNAGKVVWSGFSLAANTSVSYTVNALVAVGGNATNMVTVICSAQDTNTVNNAATNVTVIPSTIIPQVSAGIGTITMDGLNVVISGTNGVNGGTYYLLDSTDLAKPLSQWVSVATNVVSTNGAANNPFTFTATNVVTPNGAQQFYILSNTNN